MSTEVALLEKVVVGGDLSKLTSGERMLYYRTLCESVGLNPLSRPFDYLTLNGKLTLYARKDATDQLREMHQVSIVEPLEREVVQGVYCVTARARNAKERTDISLGAVSIEGLKGEALANAMMKAECVPLDAEILTRRGFRCHDTLTVGEDVLAYDSEIDECVWTPLLRVTRYDSLPMVHLTTPRRFSLRCTPDHSWAVRRTIPYAPDTRTDGSRGARGSYRSRGPSHALVEARGILTSHALVLSAPERKTTLGIMTPTEAACLGWAVTDGTIQRRGSFVRIGICQSKDQFFPVIRALVNTLAPGVRELVTHTSTRTFPSSGRTYATQPQHWWYLPSRVGRELLQRIGYESRADLPRLAASLPGDCRRAMLTAFMQAEGDDRQVFANTDPHIMETFQILSALEGYSTGRVMERPGIQTQRLKKTRHIAGRNLRCTPAPDAAAWCPTTSLGTWVMRQDGQVSITGNTKAKRRVTLSICGLGLLDETEVETIPGAMLGEPRDLNDSDRSRLIEQISVDTKFLGLMRSEYKQNWTDYVGAGVKEEDAPIPKLMALADFLAGKIKKAKDEAEKAKKAKHSAYEEVLHDVTGEQAPF